MTFGEALSIRRPIGRIAYLAAVTGLYLSQPAAALVLAALAGKRVAFDTMFWLMPFRAVAGLPFAAGALAVPFMVLMLVVAFAIAVLSFRRAITARHDMVVPTLTVVPVLQIPAALWLALAPGGWVEPATEEASDGPAAATQGMLAGMALAVAAVAMSALVFRSYGYGLFIASPFLIGLTTGYLANRGGPLTIGRTLKIVTGAALLGGVALLALALEGAVCILLASPLGVGMAMIGGAVGREFSVAGRRRAKPTAMSLAVMPLIFAIDALLPPLITIDTRQSIEIAAPPAAVWRALVSDAPVSGEVAWPIRLGLSYPMRARIVTPAVGGVRIGYFSTGVARERITAWDEDRRLAFTVTQDPPVMRELSPYRHVNAPHVQGYFHTVSTSFELLPTAGGTRVVEETRHELKLDPAPYWLPLTQYAVDRNNARVLASLKRQAEFGERGVAVRPPGAQSLASAAPAD